ncbi:serine/threonine-protein kinase [Tengunoibacter tsumagoiensis]|uniref:Protein kinase domain-containing protein n=1 Tax=Tengunoibacter tsumagoiensis TaxID=2014871 RepID=A0A402A6V0_9CHLR|nr:serine/threonine-protein kinase [Tengunoibacter tsumagoiensis]GCE14819.1 hypothetical protein KTT_46780 [Tengunoibacter tsumagoiensis]
MSISASRLCPVCQTSNPPQAAFCFGCGKPLGQSPIPSDLLHQRYHLLHKLGTGGFGAVYQAEDRQLGKRLVAIKEMSPVATLSPQENAESAEAFRKEALLLAELMHPSLPRIYDHFLENGQWYLVMDYIEGETLEDYLAQTVDGSLPLDEVLDMGLQLCDVLDYLHTRQPPIIFRDLKPLNIMRTATGHLYLIDFGIARHLKPGQAKDTIAFGSPGYAAPEQYGKSQTTPRSDIYSLGVTLYQLLTGFDPSLKPFYFAPLVLPHNQATPQILVDLLAQMLQMDEEKRPASIHEVRTELQKIAGVVTKTWKKAQPAPSTNAVAAIPTLSNPGQTVPSPALTVPLTTATSWGTPVPALSKLPPASPSIGSLRCSYQGALTDQYSTVWSPDSLQLASSGPSNLIDIWNAANGKSVRPMLISKGNSTAIAWSPDKAYLAAALANRIVQVWDTATGKTVQIYTKHMHSVTALSWSPDSRSLVSSSLDKSVQIWDLKTGATLVNYQQHHDVVYCAAWSPDGRYIASVGYGAAIHIWDARNGRLLLTYSRHSAPVLIVRWSPDSQSLASGSDDKNIHIWSVVDGRCLAICHNDEIGQIQSISWSPDGTRLVSCGGTSIVSIWDASSGQEIFAYRGHVVATELKPLSSIHYLTTTSESQLAQRAHIVSMAVWSPDGEWIASGGGSNRIHIWRAN